MVSAWLAIPLCVAGCEAPQPSAPRPNLILLLADDLGWGDVGSYGSELIRTPQLDRLAEQGMRWTQFYAASAVCSPSRCSCITGRYPLRFGFTRHGGATQRVGLPDDTVTLPRLLKQAGYRTAHVGKWHLGGNNMRELGFDQSVRVFLSKMEDDSRRYHDGVRYMERDGEPVEQTGRFMTEALVDEALKLIDEYAAGDEPFFLNLWFYAPHEPYNLAPEPYARPYEGVAQGDDLKYRSMVGCMDDGVGRIRARLEQLGIDENTLLVFTSDNGPSYQGSPGPWVGGKGDLHEGGIRMPMIAHWPGRIEAGSVAPELAHTNDLLPTFCEAAGVPLPDDVAFDGISLLSRLDGEALPERGPVFWQMDLYPWYPQPGEKPEPFATEVVRQDDWKLLALDGTPTALYDLENDPTESANLLDRRPEIRSELNGALQEWIHTASQRPPR
jgi:N-acetylgalactosamine-6-sulfatase